MRCPFGDHISVPISLACKKKTAVADSSTEAEVISLDTGFRKKDQLRERCGILWLASYHILRFEQEETPRVIPNQNIKKNILESIYYVPPNAQVSTNRTHLFIFEDNEAVIKMISKGRCPHMRHVLADASCELGLVGSFEKTKLDANASVTCVHTNQQIADITKSSFARNEWNELMIRFGIVPESFHHSPCSVVAALVPLAYEVAKRGHPFTDEASKYTGASSKSIQQAKEFSRWLQCDMMRALRRSCSRKHAIRRQRRDESKPGTGRPIACPGLHGTGRRVA